jgi:hypothetical protein
LRLFLGRRRLANGFQGTILSSFYWPHSDEPIVFCHRHDLSCYFLVFPFQFFVADSYVI